METKDYLKVIHEEIHSTVVATVDDEGHPVTRVIDMMLHDANNLYFLTAKGKAFYDQLMQQKFIAVSGMTGGEGSMSKKAVSVRGKVRNIGKQKLDEIFEKNPYMAEIYPEKESRMALEVFQIYEGEGEYFDLSTKPITRGSFFLGENDTLQGKDKLVKGTYYITDQCRGCKLCYAKCPQKCIDITKQPCVIEAEHCLHCGNCMEVCPHGAVKRVE